MRLRIIVYVANLIGAAGVAAMIGYIAPAMHVASRESFGHFGHRMADHSGSIIFLSVVLAGWLMGLLSWMVSAARDTISQIVIVLMIAASIGLADVHHVVVGSVEVLVAVFLHQGVTGADYGHFLLFATLGNIVGGSVFVALIKYGHARPRG
jgi:formate/nitrite transporter FocA (FNT family)